MNAGAAVTVALAMALPAAASAAHEDSLPQPVSLRADGKQAARAGMPIVILFSLPDCPYCHVVRQNYLRPLQRIADPRQRPLLREIDITRERHFTGFDGKPTTGKAYAQSLAIGFSPTLVFLGPDGEPLAERIVGGDTSGFYGAYLEQRLTQAKEKMPVAKHSRSKEKRP